MCSDIVCWWFDLTGEKLNDSQFYWASVSKKSNKTSYVGSLKLNHSTPAGRFRVGLLEIPISDNCSVANATFSVLNYANTSKFIEHGATVLIINADALLAKNN